MGISFERDLSRKPAPSVSHHSRALRYLVAVAVAGLLVACHVAGPAIPPRAAAVFPPAWRFRAGEPAVFAKHAMVVSNSEIASRVGADIMKRGGNAIDAAVATGFALAVTLPSAGNIGGGGFMVIRLVGCPRAECAGGEENVALDYRETA